MAIIALLIFSSPLRAKVWTTLTLVVAGALWSSVKAVAVLVDPQADQELWRAQNFLFGNESGSMDGLSALFVLIISLAAVAAVLYSKGYLAHTLAQKSSVQFSLHYTSLTVMFFAMLGVVTASGGYTFLFFWELMTISSFLLILFDAQRKEVLRAALTYLIMMHIGFVLLLVGFVRLDVVCGSADFSALSAYFTTQNPLPLFLLFLFGFGMKAGLFPLHVWLPEAHPAAPSHVSALLSGVMIKTGIYGILRVVSSIDSLPTLRTVGIMLLAAGIVTGLWGVLLAASQQDIKRLLAYSSIENIGIILIGIAVAVLGKSSGHNLIALCGICGALLHVVNHSFFKSLLFFGAGNILSQTHTTSLNDLGGLAKSMPLTALLFLVGTTAICALPPLNGFVSEFLIYLGMFDGVASGAEVLTSAVGILGLALIGGLVVLTFTKLYGTVFLGSPRTHAVAEAGEVDNFRIAAMGIPLTGILFIGLFPQTILPVIAQAATPFLSLSAHETVTLAEQTFSPLLTAVSRTAWLLVLVVGGLYLLRHRLLCRRSVRRGATWGCGFTAPNGKMQYTGESFSEGLQSIATSLTHNKGEGHAVDKEELFPLVHKFHIRHKDKIDNLFTGWWIELLHLINGQVMNLRTGKINHYILFALAFLAFIFLLSIFNLI
ncbi:MAG: proton-conducting transporter membrane subunit [Alistipes sp.]